MATDNPSVHTANEVLRVLDGKRLRFTVRVHLPDGRKVEFQADTAPKIAFCNEDRSLWLFGTAGESYNSYQIMRWVAGAILLCEENPKD